MKRLILEFDIDISYNAINVSAIVYHRVWFTGRKWLPPKGLGLGREGWRWHFGTYETNMSPHLDTSTLDHEEIKDRISLFVDKCTEEIRTNMESYNKNARAAKKPEFKLIVKKPLMLFCI